MKIERQFIDQVIPYAGNLRKFSEPGIDKVGASIEQYGANLSSSTGMESLSSDMSAGWQRKSAG